MTIVNQPSGQLTLISILLRWKGSISTDSWGKERKWKRQQNAGVEEGTILERWWWWWWWPTIASGHKLLYFVNYHLLGSPQLLRDGVHNLLPCAGFCRLAALFLPKTVLGTLKHAGTASNKIRVSMKTLQSIPREPSCKCHHVNYDQWLLSHLKKERIFFLFIPNKSINVGHLQIVIDLCVIYIVQYYKRLHTLEEASVKVNSKKIVNIFPFQFEDSIGLKVQNHFRKRGWRLPRFELRRVKRVAPCWRIEPRFGVLVSRIEGPGRAWNLQVHDPMIIQSIGRKIRNGHRPRCVTRLDNWIAAWHLKFKLGNTN